MTPLRKLRAFWSHLEARRNQLGSRPLLLNLRGLLLRLPFKPIDVNCAYLLEYKGLPPQNAALLRGPAEVRMATIGDMEGLTRCQNRPHLFLNRFEANDYCAVALVDGRIVAYQWFCARPLYTEERYGYPIEVPPDSIYEYDVFILPEHRLGGIWFKFHCLFLRELMERLGRTRILAMVDYGNRLSMNTQRRFGFRIIRKVLIARTLGRSFFIERPVHDKTAGRPRRSSRIAGVAGVPSRARESFAGK
jgi:hypothetical protein